MNRLAGCLVAGFTLACGAPAISSEWSRPDEKAQPGERVAVVLGGGGAKGGAHIGVLRVLEREGVYPDIVVGTSFGALVGGLYAVGYSPDEIEELIVRARLDDVFESLTPRESLSFRRKQDDRNLLTKLKLRLDKGRIVLPKALVSTHRFRLWLRQVLNAKTSGVSPADYPREFRAATTNLLNGELVTLGPENIEEAIYASMAFPGLFEPYPYGETFLVDGALVANLPVSLAEDLGATRIIAVEVGTPFPKKEEVDTTFAVLNQLSKILTRGNVERTLADMDESSLLLLPEVDDISTTAFPRIPEAIRIGEETAEAAVDRLPEFRTASAAADPSPELAAEPETMVLDQLTVRSDAALSERYLKSQVHIEPGETFTEADLLDSVERLYGLELFERVSYQTSRSEQGTDVSIDALEKPGRAFLQFGIELREDFSSQSTYELAAGYTRTQLNRAGAEWRTIFRIGDTTGVETEFYQPFGRWSQYFVSTTVSAVRPTIRFIDPFGFRSEFRVDVLAAEFEAGRIFGNWGKLSVLYGRGRAFIDEFLLPSTLDIGAFEILFERDTLNSSTFPSHGDRVIVSHLMSRDSLGSDQDEDRSAVDALAFFTRGPHTLGLWGTVASNLEDESEDPLPGTLQAGGFLNLSGFDFEELTGRHLGIGRMLYYNRVAGQELGNVIDVPVYLGSSVEFGNVWRRKDDISLSGSILAGSLFLGVDSIIGPLFFAVGYAEGGHGTAYLSVGRPFIYDISSNFE